MGGGSPASQRAVGAGGPGRASGTQRGLTIACSRRRGARLVVGRRDAVPLPGAAEAWRSATIIRTEGMVIMSTTTITIQVDTEAAKAFAQASPEAQRKMQLLLNLRLQDLTTAQGKSLQTVMDEIGARAEARGLTPEILKSLLDDK